MEKLTYREMGLLDDEYAKIIAILGRDPNYLELGMFAVMWSEHCGYKNSRPLLKIFPTEGPQVIQGPGENAGIVDIGDGQALVFKIESHNHPSAVEPYHGAATGVGGIVRDVFTMGARPIALLDSLRFGDITDARVRELFSGAVKGIADYGNTLGVPTVGGEVGFNSTYQGNPLVNAMCVGLVKHDEIALAVAGRIGGPILVVGGKTGRDGIHGATFASGEILEDSQKTYVQGNPHLEKRLIEACLELIREGLVDGMQDLGAAGFTSSIAETAGKKGHGAVIDVLKVPRRESGMTPYEIMLSESQERMLIVPREGKEERIKEIFDKWELEATEIGYVTGDGILKVYEGDVLAGEVPVAGLIEECPVYSREGKVPQYYEQCRNFNIDALPEIPLKEAFIKLLASPNITSKEWAFSQYDYRAMANTVIVPGDADAGVVRIEGTSKGAAMCTDCNGRLVYLDPYQGGMFTVCEAARNLACTGARPLALTNCLNFGSPENPYIYWQLQESIKGMAAAAAKLNTPIVSGNVSLYNETEKGAIFPTPIVGMIGLVDDIKKCLTMSFKSEGEKIVLLGRLRDELGGSEYLHICHDLETGAVPEVELDEEKNLIELILTLAEQQLLESCHDISEGGMAVALAECAIKGKKGFKVDIPGDQARTDKILFSEAPGRVIAGIKTENLALVEEAARKAAIEMHVLGQTGGKYLIFDKLGQELLKLPVDVAAKAWEEAIECHMK